MSDTPPPPPPPGNWDAPPPPPGSGAAPPPPPGGWNAAPTKPNIWMRFLARFIDGLILSPLSFVLIGGGISIGESFLIGVVSIAYALGLEAFNNGQTLGKMALKLRVRNAQGGPVTLQQAAMRNLFMVANLIPAIGGLISFGAAIGIAVTANSDPAGQGFHDKMAEAIVGVA